jgi:hypothetical protein
LKRNQPFFTFVRFALSLAFSNLFHEITTPWTSRYVFDDDILRYISVENKKRVIHPSSEGNHLTEYMTLVAHTSIPFYLKYADQNDEVIVQMILERVLAYLPPAQSPPVLEESHLHRWEISQVIQSRCDNLDGGVISRDQSIEMDRSFLVTPSEAGMFPFLGFAGDYFTQSNFNGCVVSARDLVNKIFSHDENVQHK